MPKSFRRSLDWGSFCKTGDRKQANEDAVAVKICECAAGDAGMFLVADGVGGSDFGSESSRAVANAFSRWWETDFLRLVRKGLDAEDLLESLNEAAARANADVRRLFVPGASGGSTLSLLLHLVTYYIVLHIGDSRIYRLPRKHDGLIRLTEDHTYVAELVKRGEITAEQAKGHHRRNVITRCLGARERPDMFTSVGFAGKGDMFLVSSDGFHNIAPEKDIIRIMRGKSRFTETAQDKAVSLRSLVPEGGAYDNLSVITVVPVDKK